MKFGTLQSITKEPSTGITGDENELENEFGLDDANPELGEPDSDEFSFDDETLGLDDESELDGEPESPVHHRIPYRIKFHLFLFLMLIIFV